MTRNLAWTPAAWADYVRWQGQDRKTIRRINRLIADTVRSPFQGEDDSGARLCDDGERAHVQYYRSGSGGGPLPHPTSGTDRSRYGARLDPGQEVLRAARAAQTGKTAELLELRDLLNDGGQGEYRCVYANVEAGQAMRDNVTEGMRTVLSQFALRASLTLGDDTLQRVCSEAMNSAGPGGALRYSSRCSTSRRS